MVQPGFEFPSFYCAVNLTIKEFLNERAVYFSSLFFLDDGICYLLQANEVIELHLQKLRYGHHHHEGRLAFVGAPFADGCRVFAQLFCKPFVGFSLIDQNGLYSVQFLFHSSKFVVCIDKGT